jgi:hypothetical protein
LIFLKINVYFFQQWQCFESKKPKFLPIFWRKHFSNHNIGPLFGSTYLAVGAILRREVLVLQKVANQAAPAELGGDVPEAHAGKVGQEGSLSWKTDLLVEL